ncbi:calponin homology domain-containing protein DDB_G0272472 [Monomorium pharaonis]|uniref:calponin homology domain-containing protein DDB_G0272472 n=1 Tax=Monomorium pharaonis TaxID=307658 RepID=UPI0017468D9E|nr:calponin homology domain-containing protein DDB_G0272472 [Monomorium pharaonis]
MKLAFPARSREAESGTSGSKNSTVSERKNIKDVRETIDIPKVVKGGPISIRSVEQNERINDTDVAELTKKKRNSESEIYSTRNSKNERNHVELLNDSPKISGDVIDKEIAVRFNEGNNDTSKNTKSGKIEIEVPSFDHVDELATDDLVRFSTTTEAAVDLNKYPFYNNDDVPSASALKYIVDPKTIPRKTPSGMEFYNSRNAYKQCDEVEPHLDAVLPEKEEPDPERGPQEDLPRLRGLGEKLDCFKAKYFDDNPLDNPLFGEKLVEEPTPPTELNPKKFATKIMVLPDEDDDYVVPQVSKKPERNSRQTWRNRFRPYETLESIRVNYKHDPQTGRGRNAYLHSMRGTRLTNMMRRVKNRKPWPKLPTTTLSPKYQTLSYQNLVYEDVMGNIRNLKNAYQVYEMTTLPPAPQILVTAGSENALKIVDLESNSSKEKSTSKPNVTDVADATVANNTKSSEIKGLVPPPKYLIQRQSYRKHRPPAKNRVSLIRPSNFPRIIAHTIKIDKRSITDDDMKDYSESLINNNKKVTINGSAEVDAKNDTLAELTKKATDRTNATTELLDLEIEESRPISTQDRSLSVSLKIDDKKKQRNSTRSDLRSEPQKTVYTIRDRIRYSKPKWDTRGFGKFTANSTIDEDSRRKEPRYKSHRFERKKKLVDDRHNNSTIMNLTGNTSGIESAMSLTDGKDTSTTEVYHAEESAVQQMVYHKKDDYSEPEKAEDVDAESEEDFFKEDEGERTTNTYQVRENINENVSKAAKADPPPSKEVVDLREYLASDPPGYAEAFSEEATTPSGKYRANVNHESDGSEEKQEEETDDLRNVANPWDNYSSEKIEGQVETPMKTNLFSQDDDSAEHLSKEEGDSNKDQTFFTYPKRPSLIEGDEDDEKATFYKPFPFSRYKSMIKKENEENEENSEEEQKKSEDYVFPWHADKENPDDKRRWLYKLNRYEYPWERRDRLAREQKQYKVGIFDDENEEESTRYERPIYPWERYNVPSKNYKVNTRRDTSRRYIDDSEESSTEHVPSTKFSSRYSSSSMKPSQFSNAREISRSIKRFLEEDDDSKEKTSTESESRSPSFARKSLPSSDKGISRGTLVPEDVTQPPRRKSPRRRILPVDKSVSKNSRFDSKKLRSEDVDEEKEEEHTEYLNKSILNEPAEVTSSQPSQLSNGTEGVPFATEQHKKRRRRILKTNSTISLDNASAESTIKPKKKRRKLEASTTTSTTPSTSVDFSLKESISTPVRKRYPKRDEKTNRSNHSGKAATNKIIVTPGTSKAVNFQETSTPKTRTIEHRSRVSKEKIVTKTTYPDKTKNFDSMKTTNLTSTQTGPVKSRIKSRRRNNNNSTMNSNNEDSGNKKELIKQERKNHEAQFVNEDEIKKSVISDKPQERNKDSASGSFEIKKEEEAKKINNFDTYDGNVNDESDNGNGGFGISSEVYAVRNLMQNIPPNRKRNRVNERTESESDRIIESWKDQNNNEEANKEEKEREEDVEQKQKPLLQAKFIKDPEHRLYYYVERK